ncbi:hypothetical protein Hanom_Chr09g00823611 [Helianthus anomalus]
MALLKALSPIRGEPKVMQIGLLVFLEPLDSSTSMAWCSRRAERIARYPPRPDPVMINELFIC